jgi:hypothetical protein
LEELDVTDTKLGPSNFEYVCGILYRLKHLTLEKTDVTDSIFDDRDVEVPLQSLNLSETKITDKLLKNKLQYFPRLEKLNLAETAMTDEGLKYVGMLRNLRSLDLSGTRITDKGILRLRSLASLEELFLQTRNPSAITDVSMPVIDSLYSLKSLSLDCPGVGDKGLCQLEHLTKVEKLRLIDSRVTNDGLRCLRNMQQLRSILLPACITQVGIDHLRANKNLADISFNTRTFSLDYLKDMRKRYPGISIIMFDGDGVPKEFPNASEELKKDGSR